LTRLKVADNKEFGVIGTDEILFPHQRQDLFTSIRFVADYYNMKNNLILIFAIIALSIISAFAQNRNKPQVLVLGIFHFDNPGLELANIKIDDVLANKRQKEITEIINLLKKFKPTKIAIEAEFESPKINQEYKDYLLGKYTLTRNEIDQIGYRLAKESGHKQIYPIDRQGNFDFDKVVEFANANGKKDAVDKLLAENQIRVKKAEADLKTKTFREIFRYNNPPQYLIEDNLFYYNLMDFGKNDNYVGTNVVSNWYQRNLKIYTNITRITEGQNDRILVLYGAGHSFLLKQFLRDSGRYTVIEANKYLK
jgi:Family of unknown function (DUF5694)